MIGKGREGEREGGRWREGGRKIEKEREKGIEGESGASLAAASSGLNKKIFFNKFVGLKNFKSHFCL